MRASTGPGAVLGFPLAFWELIFAEQKRESAIVDL